MKKKLVILIAVVMLVSLVFSTASMAAIDDKFADADFTLLFNLDGLTKEEAEAKIKSDPNTEAIGMVADAESGSNGQMAQYKQVTADASHNVIFKEGEAYKDASAFDGYAIRFKTDLAVTFHSVIEASPESGSTGMLSTEFRLIALDGTVTELIGNYNIQIPAGFDGYIMIGFNSAVFNGGKPAIRSGNMLASADGSLTFDLTKLFQASIVPTASGDVTDKYFYIGNAYMYTLDLSVDLPDLSASKLECKSVIADAKDYSGDLVASANGTADRFWALLGEGTTITAADGSINIAFGEGSVSYQYIHSTLGKKPVLNFTDGEAVAMRIKTNAAMAFWLRIDQSQAMKGVCLDVKLLSLDGKFVEAEVLENAPYKVVIPKNFDGYILYYLGKVQHDDEGGQQFTKDGAFWVNGDEKYNIGAVENYVLFAQVPEGNTFTGNEVLSIQGIYTVDVNAEGGNGGSSGNVGNTGAPLMIGTALAALASCAFVLKSSKKKA